MFGMILYGMFRKAHYTFDSKLIPREAEVLDLPKGQAIKVIKSFLCTYTIHGHQM